MSARPTPQQALDALLRTRLAAFTRKTFSTVDPGAQYIHNWHVDLIAEYLEACTRREIKRLIINIPPRYMKLLADDTPVPTPDGVRRHGDLRVGDKVFSPSGKPIKILALSPKGPADYRLTFTNGEQIDCNLDHLWTVYDRASRKWRTMETRQLLATKYFSGDRCRFQLVDSGCLRHRARDDLPLTPYFLGAWLGDGTESKPCITHDSAEQEVVARITADGYPVSTRCQHPTSRAVTTYFSHNGIGVALQSLGVWRNKHIPEAYLTASLEQRLELLAGLIDTDGSVCKSTGRVTIVATNKRLIADVFRLCAELGFRPYQTWQKTHAYGKYPGGKDVCYLGFNPTCEIPTQVPRKRITRFTHIRRLIGIRRIERLQSPATGNCITIESKDGLYVVGRRHIVTHNSISVSVAWPAWLLGKNPSERIMAASYSEMLSLKHSVDCRLTMQSDWYKRIFPHIALTGDQNEKRKFVTTQRGQRFATSVGGTATGDGGNFLIVDDPLNPSQAASEVQRTTANTWFDQTFSSRLDDKNNGVIVVVMQRLHALDLTGHLLAKGGWEHLCLPAEAEVKTVIDFGRVQVIRETGDPLHPLRQGTEALQAEKIALGSYGYAGQYQQRPAPAEGGIFKAVWLKRYDKRRDVYKRIVQSWDTAIKAAQLNDPSCCTIWGEREDGYDLLAVIVKRLEYPDLKRTVEETAENWGADAVLIEDKASGQQLIQDLKQSTKLPIIAIMPESDKVTRASAVSAMVESGRVSLPVNATWLADYETELLHFPNAPHDDQVDSTSQFLNWAKNARTTSPTIRSL